MSKPTKKKKYKLVVARKCHQYWYIEAESEKQAREMWENGLDDYDFDESVGDDELEDIVEVK